MVAVGGFLVLAHVEEWVGATPLSQEASVHLFTHPELLGEHEEKPRASPT